MDMQLQQAEIQRKAKKDILDAASKADDQQIRKQELEGRQQLDGARLGVQVNQAKMSQDQKNNQLGIDALKHAATLTQESRHKTADRADKASQPPPNKGAKKE